MQFSMVSRKLKTRLKKKKKEDTEVVLLVFIVIHMDI